ncbi:MAG: hypothetical protein AB2693_30795 [Candidatus Thiodiazotropha sp.]
MLISLLSADASVVSSASSVSDLNGSTANVGVFCSRDLLCAAGLSETAAAV